MPFEECWREREGSLTLILEPSSLAKCATISFATYAVDTLMEILLTTYLTGNKKAAEESCKKLKNYVNGLPWSLGDEVSQLILNFITQIRRKIDVFDRQPWFRNVMELYAEAVVHPRASTVRYCKMIGLFDLHYLTGPLLKRRTFKKFIDSLSFTECYSWDTTNQTYQDVFLQLKNEKFKPKNQEKNVAPITFFDDMLIYEFQNETEYTPVMYTLEDYLKQLDSLEVFILPFTCKDSYLLCQSSLRTLKIVDVCLSPRITNNAILFLGSIGNLVGLNILHTEIDHSGTVALLEKLLETSKHSLNYFLSTQMFTQEALNLLHQFPLMNDVESSLRFFSNLHGFSMIFEVYNRIKNSGELRGEKLLGYAPTSNV